MRSSLVNSNSATLPEALPDLQLNARDVYRPPFPLPDVQRKYENLALTSALQLHIAVVEVEPHTYRSKILDYAIAADCGKVVNHMIVHHMIVQGQVHRAAAHGHVSTGFTQLQNHQRTPDVVLVPRSLDHTLPASAHRSRHLGYIVFHRVASSKVDSVSQPIRFLSAARVPSCDRDFYSVM
jgi:hypothetical protein